MSKSPTHGAITARILGALADGPRTEPEIIAAIGPTVSLVNQNLQAAKQRGLVLIAGWTGRPPRKLWGLTAKGRAWRPGGNSTAFCRVCGDRWAQDAGLCRSCAKAAGTYPSPDARAAVGRETAPGPPPARPRRFREIWDPARGRITAEVVWDGT